MVSRPTAMFDDIDQKCVVGLKCRKEQWSSPLYETVCFHDGRKVKVVHTPIVEQEI
jgi:hypothetical protein